MEQNREIVMDRPSMSFLERLVIAAAWIVLILTIATSAGMLPRRSFASMVAGFVMLTASGLDSLCVCWLGARHLLTKRGPGRRSLVVLLVGMLGSVPILVVTVRLFVE